MRPEDQGAIFAFIIVGVISLIAGAIQFSQVALDYTVALTIISFVILLLSLLLYLFQSDAASPIFMVGACGLVLFGLLSLVFNFVGFQFGNSEVGQTITNTSKIFQLVRDTQEKANANLTEAQNEAEQKLFDVLSNASAQLNSSTQPH